MAEIKIPEGSNPHALDEVLNQLKETAGLKNRKEVIELIIRLAVQRANVVCPKCGHQANCNDCMSPEQLADQILTNLDSH